MREKFMAMRSKLQQGVEKEAGRGAGGGGAGAGGKRLREGGGGGGGGSDVAARAKKARRAAQAARDPSTHYLSAPLNTPIVRALRHFFAEHAVHIEAPKVRVTRRHVHAACCRGPGAQGAGALRESRGTAACGHARARGREGRGGRRAKKAGQWVAVGAPILASGAPIPYSQFSTNPGPRGGRDGDGGHA